MIIRWATMEQFDNREVNSVGSSRIRAKWLWKTWNDLYPDDVGQYIIGEKSDCLIFQKVYWEDMMEAYEGIRILDICDPDWLEGKEVMRCVNMCDAVTTSTQPLADFISKFTQVPVKCIPDRVYMKEHTPRGKHFGRAKKIVWQGYSHNSYYLYPALEFLKEKGLELFVISNQPYIPPKGFDFVKITNYSWNYPAVLEHIKECDLYLAPETNDEKGKFKSNNKILIAMALGVPTVRVPEDLDRLMEADARNEQAEKDLQEIKDKWLVEYSVKEMKELIEEVKTRKEKVR